MLAKPEKGNPLQIVFTLLLLVVPIVFIAGAVYFIIQVRNDSVIITPERHIVGNVTAASATIAWTTPNGEAIGSVMWGTSESLSNTEGDIRNNTNGKTDKRNTHIVTIENLSPNTTYYYRIKVGSTVYPSADEAPFSFTTIPLRTQSTSQPVSIYGNVTNVTDDDIIVSAMVSNGTQNSFPLITYPKTDGSWYIDISKAVSTAALQPMTVTNKHSVTVNFDTSDSGNSVIASAESSPLRTGLITAYMFDTSTAEKITPTPTPTITAPIITPAQPTGSVTPTPTVTQQFTSGTVSPSESSGTGVFNFAALKQDISLSTGQSPTLGEKTVSGSHIAFSLYKTPVLTNITDTSLSIFWITEAKEASDIVHAQTNSSGSTKVIDDRDGSISKQHRIHHVTLKKLTANTGYSYTYGQNSSSRQFSSPKTLQVQPSFQNISGSLNTFAGECVMFTQLSRGNQKSSKISTLLQTKDWILNIGPVRTEDLSQFFAPQSSDIVTFDVYCIQENLSVLSGTKSMPVGTAIGSSVSIDIQ